MIPAPKIQPKARLAAIVIGLLYGLAFRLLFQNSRVFQTMSVAFLFGVPFALGFLQLYLAETGGVARSWLNRLTSPWLPALLCLLCSLLLAWEGIICVIVWIPAVLITSSLGGLAAGLVLDYGSPRGRQFTFAWCLVLPLVISPLENQHEPARQLRTVETSILIHATPEQIWNEIKSVRAINPEELRPTWTHRIGFPRPVAATLSHEGINGVRQATFEGGVTFWETVTRWDPNQDLAFTIKADTASIPPTTLDQHVTIGGPYFDVLNGEYRLEPLGPDRVLLHLSSQHRLSTQINFYAHWWTDAIMRDIQQNILEVVQKRSEKASH